MSKSIEIKVTILKDIHPDLTAEYERMTAQQIQDDLNEMENEVRDQLYDMFLSKPSIQVAARVVGKDA